MNAKRPYVKVQVQRVLVVDQSPHLDSIVGSELKGNSILRNSTRRSSTRRGQCAGDPRIARILAIQQYDEIKFCPRLYLHADGIDVSIKRHPFCSTGPVRGIDIRSELRVEVPGILIQVAAIIYGHFLGSGPNNRKPGLGLGGLSKEQRQKKKGIFHDMFVRWRTPPSRRWIACIY